MMTQTNNERHAMEDRIAAVIAARVNREALSESLAMVEDDRYGLDLEWVVRWIADAAAESLVEAGMTLRESRKEHTHG